VIKNKIMTAKQAEIETILAFSSQHHCTKAGDYWLGGLSDKMEHNFSNSV